MLSRPLPNKPRTRVFTKVLLLFKSTKMGYLGGACLKAYDRAKAHHSAETAVPKQFERTHTSLNIFPPLGNNT